MSWQLVRLADIVSMTTGKLDSNAAVENGNYPFFTCSQAISRIDKPAFNTKAVLLGGNNAAGVFPLKYYNGEFNAYQRTYVIESLNPNILNTSFLYYSLRPALSYFQSVSIGATTQYLTKTILDNFKIVLPPIAIQNRIAATLSTYDDLIDNNRRRIQLLEKSTQLLYKEWFLHLRFPGYQHTDITDGIPEGWSTCGIVEHPYFELISDNIGQFDGFKRYYATADVSGTSITGKGVEYDYNKKPSRAQKKPEIGSVWFARMQDTYKILVFTETNRDLVENSMLSSGFVGFCARQTNFIPFLYLSIHNKRFHEEKDRFCSGATQRSLTNGGLKRIRVQVPTASVVSDFADVTRPIIDQVLTLQMANQQLGVARDLLLPRLLNGGQQQEN